MKFGLPTPAAAPPVERADRRLLCGLLVSLLLHGMVLLLQFGVPGMGMPGSTPPLTVRIASADPDPAPALPLPPLPDTALPAPAVTPPAPAVSGMRLVDPVPTPAPPPPPPPPPVKAKPRVKKETPRRAKRISPPLPAPVTLEEPTRVIAQDSTLNEFVVPLARPEEAEEKTVDIMDAQVGEDDGEGDINAELEAAAAKAGQLKAAEEAEARKLAEERARLDELEAARLAAEQDQQRQAALALDARKLAEATAAEQQRAEQQRAEQAQAEQKTAQLRVEQQRVEQQKIEQKAEQQKVEQLRLEQQKSEQLRADQQKAEQLRVEQQKSEQLRLEQQKAEQLRVAQQKVEQQRAEQQKLEQQRVEQQRIEQQRLEQQRVEQQRAEQQRAEQQRAEQQRAEQQRAEQQRADRERAERQAAQAAGPDRSGALPGGGGAGGRSAGPGGAGATGQIPRNMLGSDLANRARELVKGIDVLSGDPPGSRVRDDRRVAVGANERDLPLRMYAESWRQKIERNATMNYPRNWVDEDKKDPLVSVAVRSDGSVEDVTIITSSGRADMDEAVKRIVRVNARYSPFPAAIAQKYDVIDIRRVWRFDEVLKLMEEVR